MRYFSWRGSERVGKEGGRAAKKGLRKMHLIKKQTYQKVNTDLAYFQWDQMNKAPLTSKGGPGSPLDHPFEKRGRVPFPA